MAFAPDLTDYDVVLVNSSAGKDSQAMLDVVFRQARAAGVEHRIIVVHADLGRVEWAGARELAAEQAAFYGVRFEVVQREKGDLLQQVEQRGMWPDSQNRYCTSDQKRDQVAKLITRLVASRKDLWGAMGQRRQVRILNCLGLRSAESPARAKANPFETNDRQTNGRRMVHDWLPIHDWTTDQVWARIKESGVRHHRAYDLGMPRLSCCFCVFAPKAALVLAGQHNTELLDAYVAVEQKIGHTFRHGLSIEAVRDAVRTGQAAVQGADVESWCM